MNRNRRLKELRSWKRLTQAEMASRLEVTASLISQVERGEKAVSSNLILAAAKTFGIGLDYFDLPACPYDRMSLNFRTKAVKASTKDSIIHEFYEIERECRSLMKDVPETVIALNPNRVEDRLPLTTIEGAAEATRATLKIPLEGPIPNVMRAVERAGIGITNFSADLETEGRVDGVSSPSMDGHLVIAVTPAGSGDRQRFTTAHELGHLVLHLENRPDSEKIREDEANSFASSFLLPRESMTAELSPSMTLNDFLMLKNKWGTSVQALIRRASDLGIISQNRYQSLMIQLSSRGWRTNEPNPSKREEPLLIPKLRGQEKSNVVPLFGP